MVSSSLTQQRSHRPWLTYTVCAVFGALFGVMFYLNPLCIDDLWFLRHSTGEPGSWEYFITSVRNCADHWNYDCGRVSNMASMPFMAVFPRWIFAALQGICMALIYLMGLKVVRVPLFSWGGAFWFFNVSFVFPYADFMFTIAYSFNYVEALVLALATLGIYFGIFGRRAPLWAVAVTGFFTGWWHEGLSVPLVAALVVAYFLTPKDDRTLRQKVILIALILGTVVIFCFPAFYNQVEVRLKYTWIKVNWWESAILLMMQGWFFILALLMLAMVCIRKYRAWFLGRHPQCVFAISMLVFGAVSCPIYIVYFNGYRTGMFTQALCCLGFISILVKVWPKDYLPGKVASCLVILLNLGSLLTAIPIQNRILGEYTRSLELSAQAEAEGRNYIFLDITSAQLGLDLFKPNYRLLNTEYGRRYRNILPGELGNFQGLGDPELGFSSDSTAMLWHGYALLTEPLGEDPTAKYTLDNGRTVFTRAWTMDFEAPDSIRFYYVYYTLPVPRGRKITDVTIYRGTE